MVEMWEVWLIYGQHIEDNDSRVVMFQRFAEAVETKSDTSQQH